MTVSASRGEFAVTSTAVAGPCPEKTGSGCRPLVDLVMVSRKSKDEVEQLGYEVLETNLNPRSFGKDMFIA